MHELDKYPSSLQESADSQLESGHQDAKPVSKAPSAAHQLLRSTKFESGTQHVRPRRLGEGYGGNLWANLFQIGEDWLKDKIAPPHNEANPGSSAETAAGATSSLPMAPQSGWGTKIADVHGVDVRRNHPTSAAILREEIPGIDAPADKYQTSLRGEYGLMYQCVELVNRYYATRLGHQNMAKTGHANAYLGTGDRGLETYKNPTKTKPQEGDLMVNTDLGAVGHVGIVKSVGESSMEIAQQNTSNPIATASLNKNGDSWTIGGGWDGFRRKAGAAVATPPGADSKSDAANGFSWASLLNLVPGDFAQKVMQAGPALYESTVGVSKQGDQGPKVEALQKQLVALNYMTAEEMATGPGMFGPKTLRAVKAYQSDHGLATTGTLESGTFFSLVGGQVQHVLQSAQPSSPQYHTGLMQDPMVHGPGDYNGATTAFTGLSAADRVKTNAQNTTGGFNVKGTSTRNTYEVVKGKNGPYFRKKSQQAKDNKKVGKKEAHNTAGSSPKTNLEATGTWFDVGNEKPIHLAGINGTTGVEMAGQPVTYEANVGDINYGAHGAIHLDDGVDVDLGANFSAALVNGKLEYHYPTIPVELWGEKFLIDIGCRASAEVAASVSGKLAVDAKKSPKGMMIGSGLSGEAFAGARAGFILTAAAGWQSPEGAKDIVGGYAGAEGWAGAAAAAGVVARLVPSVKFEGYLGAAVGIGGKLQAGVEAHLGNAAKLGYLLASRGLAEAWQGLEHCGAIVAEWLQSGAGALYQFGGNVVDSVGNFLLGNASALTTVHNGTYEYLGVPQRAKLIEQMVQGTCGNEEEQAILTILRHAKSQGQLFTVIALVPGGGDTLNKNLHFSEQKELDKLLSE